MRADLGRERRGAVALEFAILSVPFMIFLLGLFEVGWDFYLQEALDYGLQSAARSVQVGTSRGVTSAATFKQNYLCPAVAGILNCNSIILNLTPIAAGSDYFTQTPGAPVLAGKVNTASYTFNPGTADQLMLAQAAYVSPSIVGGFIPGFAEGAPTGSSGLVHLTFSSFGFINER